MNIDILLSKKYRLHLFLFIILFFFSCSSALSNEARILSDIAYGPSDKERLDVYYPSMHKQDSPVIFMVHGGAWRIGDKSSKSVVQNKVEHWVAKGVIFISINYPMLPKTDPVAQAEFVEKALVFSQQNAHKWGGASEKFILMGHSAGAHLVTLISTRASDLIKPWLATISLDSAAYDIAQIMDAKPPPRLYKKAFGDSPLYWQKASPIHWLNSKLPAFFAVCSSIRKDEPCLQADNFVKKAKQFGSTAQLLSLPFSHRDINLKLGADECYTRLVDEFLMQLDPSIGSMLSIDPSSKLHQPSCID